jgi:hypothetical protein
MRPAGAFRAALLSAQTFMPTSAQMIAREQKQKQKRLQAAAPEQQ